MRFEVFMAVKIEFVVFGVLVPCSMVVGYHCFRSSQKITNSMLQIIHLHH